jgi:hypothetical protein
VDAEAVADRLYGLPPEEFTSARTASEKDARAAGDKDLASEIHRLAKPNQVAWLANQLAREHAAEIAPLVDLGAELREATDSLSGDQLRTLSRQRQQLVYALVQQARRLAGAAGKKVSEDTARGLQETLQAALADPDAAEQLLAGRLTEGLRYAGFGPVPGAGTRSAPAPKGQRDKAAGSAAKPLEDRHAQEIERAERDLERAAAAAEDAGEARAEAQAELDEADTEVSRLDTEVTRLQAELDRTVAEQSRAERDRRKARDKLGRASKTAEEAERLLEEAERRRQGLHDEE